MMHDEFLEEEPSFADERLDRINNCFKKADVTKLGAVLQTITHAAPHDQQATQEALAAWINDKRDTLISQRTELQTTLVKFYNFLEDIDVYLIKLKTHQSTQKFLQRAIALGIVTEARLPDFSHIVYDPKISHTQYLLSCLPTYDIIFADASDAQVMAVAGALPSYCDTLQKYLTTSWTISEKNPEDYAKAFELIFLLRSTAIFRKNGLKPHTIQMQAGIQLWRIASQDLSPAQLLMIKGEEQHAQALNICTTVERLHNIDKTLNPICKAALPGLEASIKLLIETLKDIHEDITDADTYEDMERLIIKLECNGLNLLATCKESTDPTSTPWITFYSNIFSQLTYGIHLFLKKIPDPLLKSHLKTAIRDIFQHTETLGLMCITFSAALQKFVGSKQATAESIEDTPAFFKANFDAAQGVSELRTNINIYTLATTFYIHLKPFLTELGIATPVERPELGLQGHITQLHTCWLKHSQPAAADTAAAPDPAASTAHATSRLGARKPADHPQKSGAAHTHQGGGGKGHESPGY